MLVFCSVVLLSTVFLNTQAISLGEQCEDSFYCSYIINAQCRDSTCQCMTGTTTYQGSCIQGYKPSKSCTTTTECISDDQYTICTDGSCHCIPNYHMRNGQCFRNKGLYEYCITDEDCYNGEDQVGLMICASRQCSCKPGYEPYRGRRCSGASQIFPPTVMIFLGVVFLMEFLQR